MFDPNTFPNAMSPLPLNVALNNSQVSSNGVAPILFFLGGHQLLKLGEVLHKSVQINSGQLGGVEPLKALGSGERALPQTNVPRPTA